MASDLSGIFSNRCKLSFSYFAKIDSPYSYLPYFKNYIYFYYKNKQFYSIILTQFDASYLRKLEPTLRDLH